MKILSYQYHATVNVAGLSYYRDNVIILWYHVSQRTFSCCHVFIIMPSSHYVVMLSWIHYHVITLSCTNSKLIMLSWKRYHVIKLTKAKLTALFSRLRISLQHCEKWACKNLVYLVFRTYSYIYYWKFQKLVINYEIVCNISFWT
jgi:hypothetical protein